MFTELAYDTQGLWLTILLVIWGILLFGGMLFGKLNAEGTHRTPTWARIGSSLILVVAVWSWYAFVRGTPAESFALCLALGMTLGCIGDVFMANLIPIKEPVLGGIAAFALGHIAYIVGFIQFGDGQGLNEAALRWGGLIFWWLMGLGGWYVVVYRGQKHTMLHYAALPYALLLATTTGFATALALQSATFVPLALGTILFLISDLLLAAQLFSGLHFKRIGDVVWLMYGPAQMLIVYSISAALRAVM